MCDLSKSCPVNSGTTLYCSGLTQSPTERSQLGKHVFGTFNDLIMTVLFGIVYILWFCQSVKLLNSPSTSIEPHELLFLDVASTWTI